MGKDTLLKAKERYEKSGDAVQLAKAEANLKQYENVLEKVAEQKEEKEEKKSKKAKK